MKLNESMLPAPRYVAPIPAILSLDNIEVPILISPVVTLTSIKLYLMMEITHGILIRAVNKAAYVNENNMVGIRTTNILREDTPDYFYKGACFTEYNVGLTGGVGLQFKIFTKRIAFLEARFAYGLNRAVVTAAGAEIAIRNNVLSLIQAYCFSLEIKV